MDSLTETLYLGQNKVVTTMLGPTFHARQVNGPTPASQLFAKDEQGRWISGVLAASELRLRQAFQEAA